MVGRFEWYPEAFIADLRTNWKGRVRRFRIHMFAFALFLLGLVDLINPYALQMLLPDRWSALAFIVPGVVAWLLRKATDHPVLVSTTYYDEQAVTDPTVGPEAGQPAPKPDEAGQ